MKKLTAVLATLVLALGLWANDAYPESDFYPQDQRTLVLVESDYDYDLNPHTASYTTEAQLLSGLFEGLFSYNPATLEPQFALCTSYKISRDKKRWTFTLRDDAKFSDGSPITAQTMKDSWIKLLTNPNAPYASMIDCISGAKNLRTGLGSASDVRINVKDKKTLVVHLDYPASHLPSILCHYAFSAFKNENVYSGAFVLESSDKKSMTFVRNPNYWDAESVVLPAIKILKSEDADENTNLFNMGLADWIASDVDADKIINEKSIRIGPEFGTCYFFFKIKNKPWNHVEFRQALLEAIPYDQLRKNCTIPAKTFVHPLSGYPNIFGLDDYDLDDAKILMKEAREKYGVPLDKKIPLIIALDDSEYFKGFADVLKSAWEPLGVEVIYQTTSVRQYIGKIDSWNADVFYYSWIGDYADPLAMLELFRSDSSLNVSKYKSKVFDNYLSQAAESESVSERYSLLSKAEEKLLSDSVVIPLYHQVSLNILDAASIGGWSVNALDLHPLKYLYIKRKTLDLPNLI